MGRFGPVGKVGRQRIRAWMPVFSSELMMWSLGPSGWSSQRPAYRSKTRPAFSANRGSRGKIQYLYRQGLMASASRMRQTVLGLIVRPRAVAARAARSAVESRLRGNFVWATASHAMALTRAWSRGGKIGLTPAPGVIDQREVPERPTSAPEADRVGVEIHERAGRDVG